MTNGPRRVARWWKASVAAEALGLHGPVVEAVLALRSSACTGSRGDQDVRAVAPSFLAAVNDRTEFEGLSGEADWVTWISLFSGTPVLEAIQSTGARL